MKVLITGASGYSAQYVSRALIAAGHSVRGLVRPSSTPPDSCPDMDVHVGDLMVPESLTPALRGVDAVVHLGALRAAASAAILQRTNVNGTRHVAEAAAAARVKRFIFVSSLAAQGPSEFGTPHSLPGGENPLPGYGESKLLAEHALKNVQGLDYIILRPSRIYGPGDPDSARWAAMARAGLLPVRRRFELSFLHVQDLCQAISLSLSQASAGPGPYFLSDGQTYTMQEVSQLLSKTVARRLVIKLPIPEGLLRLSAPGLTRLGGWARVDPNHARMVTDLAASSWACKPDVAHRDLGFRPNYNFAESFPEILAGQGGA